MYRLIPFKSMDDINISVFPEDLYRGACKERSILIQDTEDMVVESFSADELKHLEEFSNIEFVSFSFIKELGGAIDTISFSYENDFDISSEDFLNGDLKVRIIRPKEWWHDAYFPDFNIGKEGVYFSYWGNSITYKGNIFELEVALVETEDPKSERCIMFINKEPVYTLKGAYVRDEGNDIFFSSLYNYVGQIVEVLI